MSDKPPQFPYNHLGVLGINKLKRYVPPSKEWCMQAAELEGDSEVGVGGGLTPGLSPEDLAPLVERIAEKLAQDINGSGVNEQLKFLESNGWDIKMVVKYLSEDTSDDG